ncbi:endodeoxyribonuclease RusA, partial [Pseudomonas putida]
LAMFKAGRDGLADALGIDDNVFATQIRVSKETTKGGAVRVRIQAQEAAA